MWKQIFVRRRDWVLQFTQSVCWRVKANVCAIHGTFNLQAFIKSKRIRVLNSFRLRTRNHGNNSTCRYIIWHDVTSKLISFDKAYPVTKTFSLLFHRRTKKLKISRSINLQSKKSPQIDLDDVNPVGYLELVSEKKFYRLKYTKLKRALSWNKIICKVYRSIYGVSWLAIMGRPSLSLSRSSSECP